MSKNIFRISSGLCMALWMGLASAQNGPVTSRLTTAKFALMKGWYSTSDHGTSTPINFVYMAKLMAANGISVDTFYLNTSVAPLAQASLDKYDVIVWYNVYRMYEHIDTATGNRIQRWYENGNKGLGCIHQCVRSSVTAQNIPWTWWINMMGKDYNTYANTGATGPVYIDREALGTIFDSTKYTAHQSFSWSDEWYTYVGPVRGLPGTKMMWTTADSAFKGVTFNSTMGNDHPLAWVRDFDGGRFSLNGMYHTTALATATGTFKTFADDAFIGTMKFLAGYTGCKDSNYVEYNKLATHSGVNACVTPRGTNTIWLTGNKNGVKLDAFRLTFSQPGKHSVEIFNTSGVRVASRHGEGAREYRFAEILQPGVYFVKIMTSGMKVPFNHKIILW